MQAYIIDGLRTPMGKAGGALAAVRPDDLAAHVMSEILRRNPDIEPVAVEDIFWGATNQAADDARNVARIAALLAGLPIEVAGMTVNRLCGSGLQAVVAAAQAVMSGEVSLAIAGGSESMSRAPFILPRAEKPFQNAQPVYDSRLGWRSVNPRWLDRFDALSLGECAELAAKRYGISRDRQDEFALQSHQKAASAWRDGRLAPEVVPVPSDLGVVKIDETVRFDPSLEALARLRPAFAPGGTVTAGNSSPMNDGAAALIVASEETVDRLGLKPMASYVAGCSVGVHPDSLTGPVPATERLVSRIGWRIDDVDLIELNEAFASQSIACIDELRLDPSKVNVNGGAIALGHPLGASGARLATTLMYELARRGGGRGLATMCIGVGQGISVALEVY